MEIFYSAFMRRFEYIDWGKDNLHTKYHRKMGLCFAFLPQNIIKKSLWFISLLKVHKFGITLSFYFDKGWQRNCMETFRLEESLKVMSFNWFLYFPKYLNLGFILCKVNNSKNFKKKGHTSCFLLILNKIIFFQKPEKFNQLILINKLCQSILPITPTNYTKLMFSSKIRVSVWYQVSDTWDKLAFSL